ncbi:MAG: TonB-dependent receptor [Prolixibacteraceae bacterium]|jgi:TonB-linked SusC/RagA family outer membrane protein
MKKKHFSSIPDLCRYGESLISLKMRVTLILFLICIGQTFAVNGYSQNKRLSISLSGVSIKSVLSTIEDQTEFFFMYEAHSVDVEQKVSISVENRSVPEILNKLFASTNIIYKINDRQIALSNESTALVGQQLLVVSGRVTDSSGAPLPGVTVVVKGSTRGTITDTEGEYRLENIGDNATVQFSFVGMIPQEIPVAGKSTINLIMSEETVGIEEVVAVGYGTARKSDISGSVASVNREEMMRKNPTNILQGIQGQAAGVLVTSQDGAPDANAAIRIRGVATINGTANPLYVVDGVQVGTNANFLAPSDIESIEVLKDASATAIYGAAGANGVIMITTKHGKVGTTHLTFSADYGIQTLASTLDVGNVDQFAKNIRTGRANDGGVPANAIFTTAYDGKRKNIDWQKEMTHTSLKQQYNLSASGGTEKTQSNLSLSYLNNDGIVINTNYNRLTARANIITKVSNFIEIGGDINYVHSESHGSNFGLNNNGNLSSLRDMAFMCPTMDYVDADGVHVSPNVINDNGTYGTTYQYPNSYDGGTTDNLVATQMENNGLTKKNQVFTSAYANIKLYKGLTFKTIASYNLSTSDFNNFRGNKQRYEPDGVTKVTLRDYDARYYFTINGSQDNTIALESYLTYNWKNDIHNLTLMAGNSITKSFGDEVSAEAYDFPAAEIRDISLTSDPTTRTGNGKYHLQVRGISYFGRATYSLKDRYILTGTVRRDGSSNFGASNMFGTFPSLAAAWRISEENFIKGTPAISNLKLRLGWGQTGNSGGATDKAINALTSKSIGYYYYAQDGASGLGTTKQTVNGYVKVLVDPNLKWETNEQSNIGIDLGLFENSLNITVDYFTRTSKDLLLEQSLRASSGDLSIYTNYGEIQNKGIEFSLNYKKQINRDWNIGATLTGSSLKNKVIKMGGDLFSVNGSTTNDGSNVGAVAAPAGVHWDGHSICREGYAVGSFYGYQVEGVFQSQAEVDALNVAATEASNARAIAAGHLPSTFVPYQKNLTGVGDFKYKDINGDGLVDENDMTILGNGFPKLNYGLTLNASYKNWDFSVYAYGVLGQQIYSYSAMTLSNIYGTDNGTIPNILTSAANEAWTLENKSNTLSKLSIMDYNQNMRGSSAWVKNGDFLKISNIQVGYNFDKNFLKSLHLGSTRLYVSVQNVLCISSYNKYGDPEAGQGSVLYTGLDTGRYPQPRIYSVGLNLQF